MRNRRKNLKKELLVMLILLLVFGISCGYAAINHKNVIASEKQKKAKEDTPTRQSALAAAIAVCLERINRSDLSGQELGYLTEGSETYQGFVIDNIFHSKKEGEIHYNVYIPSSYDGSKPYALYVTLPGYEGLYFQGVASNIKSEAFGFEAQKYNEEMFVLAPQLGDWGETSANQTIALIEYFLAHYNLDDSRVYANGYSGGGETLSLVLEKRPELFAACLHVSSCWDGAYEPVVRARVPLYFAIGQKDEYYGSEPVQKAYDTLYALYEKQGLTEEEIAELLVLDIKEHSYFTERKAYNEHGGGGLFAYDEAIMGWLFGHEGIRH